MEDQNCVFILKNYSVLAERSVGAEYIFGNAAPELKAVPLAPVGIARIKGRAYGFYMLSGRRFKPIGTKQLFSAEAAVLRNKENEPRHIFGFKAASGSAGLGPVGQTKAFYVFYSEGTKKPRSKIFGKIFPRAAF